MEWMFLGKIQTLMVGVGKYELLKFGEIRIEKKRATRWWLRNFRYKPGKFASRLNPNLISCIQMPFLPFQTMRGYSCQHILRFKDIKRKIRRCLLIYLFISNGVFSKFNLLIQSKFNTSQNGIPITFPVTPPLTRIIQRYWLKSL